MSISDYVDTYSYEKKKQIIKSYPIEEYAQNIGFEVKRRGRFWQLVEHPSVMIDTKTNTYRHYSQGLETKSIIDFSMEFEGVAVKEAWKRLCKFVLDIDFVPRLRQKSDDTETQKRAQLNLPPKSNDYRKIYAYLIKTRCIDTRIVSSLISSKNLFQDEKGNCVFVSYSDDGEANFASLRGTNTYKRFMGDVPGCDYSQCFLIGNRQAAALIVCESVIDLMSVMTLVQEKGKDLNNYAFLALSGVAKYQAVCYQIQRHRQITKVIMAVDNDDGGLKCIENVCKAFADKKIACEIILFLPQEKDWNAQLQKSRKGENI